MSFVFIGKIDSPLEGWHKEYILVLHEVHKLQLNNANAINKEDIVLVQYENIPKQIHGKWLPSKNSLRVWIMKLEEQW